MRTATGGAGAGAGSCSMRVTAMTKSNLARSRRSGTGGCEAIAGANSGRTPAPWKLSQSMTPQQAISSTVRGTRFLPSSQASEIMGY